MREFIIAANWKMNQVDTIGFFREFDRYDMPTNVTAVVCVPFTLIPSAVRDSDPAKFAIGAQDVSAHDAGAYTGEVSGDMLAYYTVRYAIVGHSERRRYHGESDELVRDKTLAALRHGLRPIVCVGETLDERKAGDALAVILRQTKAVADALTEEDLRRVAIAYEPVWAIGTGVTASPKDADEACGYIGALARVPVLYGGSMNADNAAELLAQPNINGGLIGGASLDAKKFRTIIDAAGAAR